MKRNFWICLLVFSLALNLGGVATFAYMRYQDRASPAEPTQLQPFQEMWGPLNLEPGQKQALGSLLPEHRRRVRDLREELAQKRFELFEMVKEGATAWPAIQEKLREVSVLQGRAAFIAFMERRMPDAQGGKGRRSPRRKRDMGAGAPQATGPCGP
jgi:Spy/CpxP family protein refolding chaperone